MKHKTITYSESYEFKEYGMSRWRKIGLETEIEEGECPMQVHLKQFEEVSAIKATTLASLDEFRGTSTKPVEEVPQTKEGQIQAIIRDISTVTDPKVLESYRLIAKSNPEIQAAYDNKLKLLIHD